MVQAGDSEIIHTYNYKKDNTISWEEYLYTKKSKKDRKTLKLNSNGDVIFKNRVILTNKGVPLNKDTAYSITELQVLIAAKGVKPHRWCNPKNTAKNGIFGCYIDKPNK